MSGERPDARAPGCQGSDLALSVVIPVRNEVDSVAALASELAAALDRAGLEWEALWVDDASSDGTRERIAALGRPHRLLALAAHHGQGRALAAGIRAATGAWIASLDGDGQNDPADLPRLLALARERELDAVLGIRRPRHDDARRRRCSRLAGWCRDRVLGERIADAGCATRVLSRAAARELPDCPGLHVLVGSLLRIHHRRWCEVPVRHRPRRQGSSHYGTWARLLTGLDQLAWVLAYRHRYHQTGQVGRTSKSDQRVASAFANRIPTTRDATHRLQTATTTAGSDLEVRPT